MTIRKKIFILAGILLALFGLVVGALAFVQKLNNDQISNIVAYELPLTRLVSEFDVDTDKYELVILRALHEESPNSLSLKTATLTVQAIAEELRADAATANSLMDKAIQDPHYQIADRVDLARISGALKYLDRNLDDFVAVGQVTMNHLNAGQQQEALLASKDFAKFVQAFGPDLAHIRSLLFRHKGFYGD
jgi:adenylate cyclase